MLGIGEVNCSGPVFIQTHCIFQATKPMNENTENRRKISKAIKHNIQNTLARQIM